MKDLKLFAKRAIEKCIECNIPVDENKTAFIWNKRAKKRWGQCKRNPNGTYEISISIRLGKDDVPDKSLEEVLLHELCHATPKGSNHTGMWKVYVSRLNNRFGFNIKRTNSNEEMGVVSKPRVITYKYNFVCEGCGQIVRRQKESRFTKHYQWYHCAKCKGKFKPITIK